MILTKTDILVKKYLSENLLGNIAIRVGIKNDVIGEVFASSEGQTDADTIFDIASITKILSVTACSLIALDRGDISLSDKVSKYFPVTEHNSELKVFNLLTHTTGVGHRDLTSTENNYNNIAEKILEIKGNHIGVDVEYSCPAFILMGKILEKIYGARLDILFKKMVSEPLGMANSGFCPNTNSKRIVNSNLEPEKVGIVNDYNCQYLGGVAGNAGIFSCVSDLTLFVEMLLNNGKPLFSKNILNLASQNHTPGMSEARGIGFVYVDERYNQTGKLFPIYLF